MSMDELSVKLSMIIGFILVLIIFFVVPKSIDSYMVSEDLGLDGWNCDPTRLLDKDKEELILIATNTRIGSCYPDGAKALLKERYEVEIDERSYV